MEAAIECCRAALIRLSRNGLDLGETESNQGRAEHLVNGDWRSKIHGVNQKNHNH